MRSTSPDNARTGRPSLIAFFSSSVIALTRRRNQTGIGADRLLKVFALFAAARAEFLKTASCSLAFSILPAGCAPCS
jgi:hypothetical protein